MNQPKVNYKFARSLRLELGTNDQVDIEKGDILPIPIAVAMQLNKSSINYGEICDEPRQAETQAETEAKLDNETNEVKLHKSSELKQLSMGKLRDVGELYEVKDNKKDELVDKILVAQPYFESFLKGLEKEDLGDIVLAMQMNPNGDLVEAILAVQESE